MKQTFSRYVNLLMACLVLLSSTGFGLIEHTCLMRGKKVSMSISPSAKTTCAVHQKKSFAVSRQSTLGPVVKRADCCKEEQRYENVDFSSSLTQLVAKFIKSVTDLAGAAAATLVSWLVETLFEVETESAAIRIHAPPLPFGRSLLSFVQSFLL